MTSAVRGDLFEKDSFMVVILLDDIKMANGKHGRSLVANKHKHRHSGFSAAECPGACQFRCSKTAYRKPCLYFLPGVLLQVQMCSTWYLCSQGSLPMLQQLED
ncbi:hypothetical protein HPP92_004512 [Vanilla planifolia]|uniref:Uncharacterized protein n=1 Tax=Vanilla planifolia TaxID=51239 RepID=A0A835RWW4_VANPL|nr:hypothetical protein HPP92_004512 [Vanilla planifolia]